MHLILNAKVKRLTPIEGVKLDIMELIKLIGMTPVGEMQTNAFEGYPWGGSVIQMLAESHISYHAMADRVWFDCFSCKPFQEKLVYNFVWERFLCTEQLLYLCINRGIGIGETG